MFVSNSVSQCWKQSIELGYVLQRLKAALQLLPTHHFRLINTRLSSELAACSWNFTEVCTRPCLEKTGGLTQNSQLAVMCRGERQRDVQQRGGRTLRQPKLLRFKAILLAGLDARSSSVVGGAMDKLVIFLYVCVCAHCCLVISSQMRVGLVVAVDASARSRRD